MRTYDGARAVPGRAVDYGTVRIVRAGSGLSDGASRRILDRASTAVQRYQLANTVGTVHSGLLQTYSRAKEGFVTKFFLRNSNEGPEIATDGGTNVFADIHDLDLRSVDSEALADNVAEHYSRLGQERVRQTVDDISYLERNDVEGVEYLIRDRLVHNDYTNFKGGAAELRVARRLDESSEYDFDVTQLGREVSSSGGATEIDITTSSGSTIEVKSGNLETKDQLETQMAYRRGNGLSGNHYVYVQGEITTEAMNYINTNNIRVINEGDWN